MSNNTEEGHMRRGIVGAIATTGAVIADGVFTVGVGGLAGADGGGGDNTATFRDASGTPLGTVAFSARHDKTEIRIRLRLDPTKVTTNAHHGMHIHANADPSNGVGCIADPAKEPTTWFVSADGHWKAEGQDHGSHHGDLTSVYVASDGSVDVRSTTGPIDRAQLKGKAIVVHALADNFGNVPVGTAPNQYAPNAPDASALTKNTGNAGTRIACGVIGER
jgi:superoxide dismutase, Cu-Zn family